MSALDLDSIYAFAIALAQDAGKMIASASLSRTNSNSAHTTSDAAKKNRVDLVTATDQAVEQFVRDRIEQTYPTHKFIGEESFAGGETADLTAEPTWIIDPIDGTTNFTKGFDHVCISIGFTVNKIPTIGVIFNPFQLKLYRALVGKGAYLEYHGTTSKLPLCSPEPPLPLGSLADALIGVEWGSDRSKSVMEKKSRSFVRLAGDGDEVEGGIMCLSLRSIGSAALLYSYVAAGGLDCYWEIGCWSWDVCAGTVIAREAGGRCYGRDGKPFSDDGVDLMGHHFFVVRAIGDTETEKGSDAQDRIAKQFFSVVEQWDC